MIILGIIVGTAMLAFLIMLIVFDHHEPLL